MVVSFICLGADMHLLTLFVSAVLIYEKIKKEHNNAMANNIDQMQPHLTGAQGYKEKI